MSRVFMSRAFTFAAILATTALVATPVSAQLLQRKDLSYKIAVELAQEALAECHRHNWPSSVVVVDRAGDTMVMLRDDNAGPHTVENARRKAYTARTFKMTTEEFSQRMEKEPVRRQQATLPGIIGIPGGVPIKVGDEVIGGVGLSGSPGKDADCIKAGMDKVQQYLQ